MNFAGKFNILAKPWIWSYLGAFLVWLAAIVFTRGYGAGGMLTAALALAVFSVIAGVAQMFVHYSSVPGTSICLSRQTSDWRAPWR